MNQAQFTESALDSAHQAKTQNLLKINQKSLSKFLLLFAFAKSRVPPNFIDSNLSHKVDSQNLRGNPQGFARVVARSNHPPIKNPNVDYHAR